VIRVLHIDDEAPIRLLARVNLEWEAEMEVIEAADGRTGVRLAKRELPDLILLNVNLPGLDGWHVAEELHKDEETREIPIVFLTARSELKELARGLELGAVDYITNPFNPSNWPHASAGCWNGSSAVSETSCGGRRSRNCARSWARIAPTRLREQVRPEPLGPVFGNVP